MDDLGEVFIYFICFLAAIFIGPAIFMIIWNNIIPNLCGFNEITFWQAFFLGLGIRVINGSIGIKSKIDNK